MKSRTQELQDELKAELRRSAEALFAVDAGFDFDLPTAMLRQALRVGFPGTSFAIVLDHIPDQGEDVWSILVDVERVAIVEVPKRHAIDTDVVSIKVVVREVYERRRLSKQKRRKLKAAIELMRERTDT